MREAGKSFNPKPKIKQPKQNHANDLTWKQCSIKSIITHTPNMREGIIPITGRGQARKRKGKKKFIGPSTD